MSTILGWITGSPGSALTAIVGFALSLLLSVGVSSCKLDNAQAEINQLSGDYADLSQKYNKALAANDSLYAAMAAQEDERALLEKILFDYEEARDEQQSATRKSADEIEALKAAPGDTHAWALYPLPADLLRALSAGDYSDRDYSGGPAGTHDAPSGGAASVWAD